jgi:hypothetical protein
MAPTPLRFDLPPGLLRAGTNVVEREWATHENMLLMPRLAVGEARHVDQAYSLRDLAYRVLPGASLVTAAVLVLLNLVVDVLYALVDPRVRYGKR